MGDSEPERGSGRIVAIQALRAVAAALVAWSHARIAAHWLAVRLGLEPAAAAIPIGGLGVDLFFVLSGFVMVVSSAALFGRPRAAATFLTRRAIRIAPLYWLVTLLSAAWLFRMGPGVAPSRVAASLLFWPHAPGGIAPALPPVVNQGWTLNFEAFFYLVFAAALFLRERRAVAVVVAALIALALAGALLPIGWAPLFAWTRPIILEFAGGTLIALAYRRGVRLPGWLRLALTIAACAIWIASPTDFKTGPGDFASWQGWRRLAWWGGPAIAMVVAATLGPVRMPAARLWNRLGDASYALYLWHMLLFVVATFLVRRLHLPFWREPLIALMLVAAQAWALVSFAWIERPLTTWLNQRLLHRHRDRRLEETGV